MGRGSLWLGKTQGALAFNRHNERRHKEQRHGDSLSTRFQLAENVRVAGLLKVSSELKEKHRQISVVVCGVSEIVLAIILVISDASHGEQRLALEVLHSCLISL